MRLLPQSPAPRRKRLTELVSSEASLSTCRFFATFISITAIMPHAVHCGKPRAAGGCHAIALRFGHFSAKRNDNASMLERAFAAPLTSEVPFPEHG
jgi:hypothetical protein